MNGITKAIMAMDSREIAELTGKSHTKVMRDIKKQLKVQEIGEATFGHSYKSSQNKHLPCFRLDKEQVMCLVTGYSIPLRMKVIKRLNELEEKLKMVNKLALPSYQIKDPVERAKRWIAEQEQIQTLQIESDCQQQIIGELQPKVDYLDIILSSKSTVLVTQIAKDYSLSAQALNKILHEEGVLFKRGGQWLVYAIHHHKGYTKSDTPRKDKYDFIMHTRWTQKGRLFIYGIMEARKIKPIKITGHCLFSQEMLDVADHKLT